MSLAAFVWSGVGSRSGIRRGDGAQVFVDGGEVIGREVLIGGPRHDLQQASGTEVLAGANDGEEFAEGVPGRQAIDRGQIARGGPAQSMTP